MINITIEIDGEVKQISIEQARELQKQLNELFGVAERLNPPKPAKPAKDLTEAFKADWFSSLHWNPNW